MAEDDTYVDDFDEVEVDPASIKKTLFNPGEMVVQGTAIPDQAPVQEPLKRRLSGSFNPNRQQQGPPQEKEKLIAKDGDVGYDSDEGFTMVKKDPSLAKDDNWSEQELVEDGPRTPTPEPEEELARTPTPEEEVVGMYDDGGPKAATPPPAGVVSGGARYDDNNDAYSDDFDGRQEEDTGRESQLREAWPPKVDHQEEIPLGRDGSRASSDEPLKEETPADVLRKKNNDLRETIKALSAQIAKLKPVKAAGGPKKPTVAKTSCDAMTANRNHTEYAIVKKENDALTSKVKQFNRLDTLERRLAATEVEIEELEAQKKQRQNVIRGNTKRLMDGASEKQKKLTQELKTEKKVVVAGNKKSEKEGQLAGNHMEFVAQRLGKAQDDTTELDQDSLKAVQELIAVLEEREKDVESLQYRIEVLRKAKESSTRVTATQATTCAESQEVSRLRNAVALMQEKIERFEANQRTIGSQQDPMTPVLNAEGPERSQLEKLEIAERKPLAAAFKKGKDAIIATFVAKNKADKVPAWLGAAKPTTEETVVGAQGGKPPLVPKPKTPPPQPPVVTTKDPSWLSKDNPKEADSPKGAPPVKPELPVTSKDPSWLSKDTPKEADSPKSSPRKDVGPPKPVAENATTKGTPVTLKTAATAAVFVTAAAAPKKQGRRSLDTGAPQVNTQEGLNSVKKDDDDTPEWLK